MNSPYQTTCPCGSETIARQVYGELPTVAGKPGRYFIKGKPCSPGKPRNIASPETVPSTNVNVSQPLTGNAPLDSLFPDANFIPVALVPVHLLANQLQKAFGLATTPQNLQASVVATSTNNTKLQPTAPPVTHNIPAPPPPPPILCNSGPVPPPLPTPDASVPNPPPPPPLANVPMPPGFPPTPEPPVLRRSPSLRNGESSPHNASVNRRSSISSPGDIADAIKQFHDGQRRLRPISNRYSTAFPSVKEDSMRTGKHNHVPTTSEC